jgi:acylphosphatase
MSDIIISCKKFRIEGRVQGVFYRASAQREALALKITGFAKNEQDGTVTVLACGEEAALKTFENWLKKGPPVAKVTAVIEQVCDNQDFSDFTTL